MHLERHKRAKDRVPVLKASGLEFAESDSGGVREAEAELAPCLTAMIARLGEPCRTAIELTSVQGLTQAEASKQAGISVSGMKSRVQRWREQLRQMLVDCCEIALDVRGGVADFHRRAPNACGAASFAKTKSGCAGKPRSCAE